MADLGAIGTRARNKPYYGLNDARPWLKDRTRPYMKSVHVLGIFTREKAEASKAGHFRYVPFYINPGNVMADPCNGLIAGTTQQNGIPAPFKPVHLYHRPNLVRVRSTVSDEVGAFSFPCVAKDTRYLIMSLDTLSASPDFDADVRDWVEPVAMP